MPAPISAGPIDGAAPWVMLYDNQRSGDSLLERLANVGFIVRSYRATLGDEVVTTPHINIHRTFNGGFSQMGLSWGSSTTKRAVSSRRARLQAVVEYVIPADKEAYYGQSEYPLAMPRALSEHRHASALPRRTAIAKRWSGGGAEQLVGSTKSTAPRRWNPTQRRAGLRTGDHPRLGLLRRLALERLDGEAWVRVDQSVEGNDYWQAASARPTRPTTSSSTWRTRTHRRTGSCASSPTPSPTSVLPTGSG